MEGPHWERLFARFALRAQARPYRPVHDSGKLFKDAAKEMKVAHETALQVSDYISNNAPEDVVAGVFEVRFFRGQVILVCNNGVVRHAVDRWLRMNKRQIERACTIAPNKIRTIVECRAH